MEEIKFPLITENSEEFLALSNAEQNALRFMISKKALELRFKDNNCVMFHDIRKKLEVTFFIFGNINYDNLIEILDILSKGQYIQIYATSSNIKLLEQFEDNKSYLSREYKKYLIYRNKEEFELKFQQAKEKFETKNPNLKVILQNEIDHTNQQLQSIKEFLSIENQELISLIINRTNGKIDFYIANKTRRDEGIDTGIYDMLNKWISVRQMAKGGGSYIVTTQNEGQGFGSLVTAFRYKKQVELE